MRRCAPCWPATQTRWRPQVAAADIAATAVGVRALPFVAPLVAAGIARRAAAGNTTPLNIIICENLKDAAATFRGMVLDHLPAELRPYLDSHIGFVDTVIGRMIPPLLPELRADDPTLIIVEPYKELPVDRARLDRAGAAGGGTGGVRQLPGLHRAQALHP